MFELAHQNLQYAYDYVAHDIPLKLDALNAGILQAVQDLKDGLWKLDSGGDPYTCHTGWATANLIALLRRPSSCPGRNPHNLDQARYLGVGTEVAGLVDLAESGELQADSIVVLLAAAYSLGATAVLLRIIRSPVLSVDGVMHTAA